MRKKGEGGPDRTFLASRFTFICPESKKLKVLIVVDRTARKKDLIEIGIS
jgi:hypothetical protein